MTQQDAAEQTTQTGISATHRLSAISSEFNDRMIDIYSDPETSMFRKRLNFAVLQEDMSQRFKELVKTKT